MCVECVWPPKPESQSHPPSCSQAQDRSAMRRELPLRGWAWPTRNCCSETGGLTPGCQLLEATPGFSARPPSPQAKYVTVTVAPISSSPNSLFKGLLSHGLSSARLEPPFRTERCSPGALPHTPTNLPTEAASLVSVEAPSPEPLSGGPNQHGPPWSHLETLCLGLLLTRSALQACCHPRCWPNPEQGGELPDQPSSPHTCIL